MISIPLVLAFKESTTSNINVNMQLGRNTNEVLVVPKAFTRYGSNNIIMTNSAK